MEVLLQQDRKKWRYFFLFLVLRILHATYRYRLIGPQRTKEGQPFILASWHEHIPALILSQGHQGLWGLVSKSTGGRLAGVLCHYQGFQLAYGSQDRDHKDKGGLAALLTMLTALRKGASAAITVDGSTGPRHKVKAGILSLAAKSGTAILPISFAYSRYWELPTWDKLKIPKPFARIIISHSSFFTVPKELRKDEEMQVYQQKLAEALMHETELAQAACKA